MKKILLKILKIIKMKESKFQKFWGKWGYLFPLACGISFMFLDNIFLGVTNLFLSLSLYMSNK